MNCFNGPIRGDLSLPVVLFREAGLGERVESYVSPSMSVTTCLMPYVRFGAGPAEYVVLSVLVVSHLVAGTAYSDSTGRILHRSYHDGSEAGVRDVVAGLLSWWKENKHRPAFA